MLVRPRTRPSPASTTRRKRSIAGRRRRPSCGRTPCPGTSISESRARRGARAAHTRGRWRCRVAFLGQPIRVLSGERPDEPRLAVVDVTAVPTVTGMRLLPHRQLCDLDPFLLGERARVEQGRPPARPDHRRISLRSATASSSSSAQAKLGRLRERECARRPPDRPSPRRRRLSQAGKAVGAGTSRLSRGLAQHARQRCQPGAVEIQSEGSFERGRA